MTPDELRSLIGTAFDEGFDISGEGWNGEYGRDYPDENYQNLRAITIERLLEQTETPEEETGDVERVAKAISPYLQRSYSGTNPDVDDQARGRDTALHVAGLAITAMRPVSVDRERLAKIRRQHIATAHDIEQGNHRWEDFSAERIHADRAFLLSVIEGVSHDD